MSKMYIILGVSAMSGKVIVPVLGQAQGLPLPGYEDRRAHIQGHDRGRSGLP